MNDLKKTADVDNEGTGDWDPLFDYLESERGHQLASRVIDIVEDIKKAALEKSAVHATFEIRLQATVIVVVILATSILTYFERFDSSIGVLFGTLVGYIYGKR